MAKKIRKGDFVKVIAGSQKGKQGVVLSASDQWVVVEGVNMVIKHRKPTSSSAGSLETFPGNIHISNVQHCIDGEAVKVTFKPVDGKKVLVCKKTDKEIRRV